MSPRSLNIDDPKTQRDRRGLISLANPLADQFIPRLQELAGQGSKGRFFGACGSCSADDSDKTGIDLEFEKRSVMHDIVNIRFHTGFSMCNFSCAYCIAGHGELDQNGEIEDKTWDGDRFERIVENLKKLPFTMNIRLRVPGEIFLNKRLLSGAKNLAQSPKVRSLNILTNLSLSADQYRRVLSDIDAAKWAFVASFHPTEVKERRRWMEAATYMNEMFDFAVVLVAYPPLLRELPDNKERLERAGLEVFVQAFIGLYGGKQYPQAYTAEERRALRAVFYSRHDYEFLVALKKPGLCDAGCRSFYVDETGLVTPCGVGSYAKPLGDMSISPNLRLSRAPQICPFDACQCDTENMNSLIFKQYYRMKGINQHKYVYRFRTAATVDPNLDEWRIPY